MNSIATEHPVAIVTGAGSGIGRATAIALADQGVRILGVGRRAEALQRTTELARGVEPFAADLRDRQAPVAVVRKAVDLWGRVDIVVNNAGGTIRAGLDTVLAEQVDELFAIHVIAPTLLTRRRCRGCARHAAASSTSPARSVTAPAQARHITAPRRVHLST